MEPSRSKTMNLNDWEWLSMFYQSAREVGEIVVDDFATIKRRMIDRNEEDLKKESGSNTWLAKKVVKNFVQSITKSVENLAELKVDVVRELKIRYPNIEGDWLSENCVTVSSSVKSPNDFDSNITKDGNVSEERERKGELEELELSEISDDEDEVVKKSTKSKNKREESPVSERQLRKGEKTQSAVPKIAKTPVEVPSDDENKSDKDKNVISESESDSENEALTRRKENQNNRVENESTSSSPFKPVESIDIEILNETETADDSFDQEMLSDVDQVIPGTPMSSQEDSPTQALPDKSDDEQVSDSGIHTENEKTEKEKPAIDLDSEDETRSPEAPAIDLDSEDGARSPEAPIQNYTLPKIFIGDEENDETLPSENDETSKSVTKPSKNKELDKESLKAKRQVLMSDSSDDEDFKSARTSRKKPIKSTPEKSEKSKEQDKDKEKENKDKDVSKKKSKIKPSPRSKRRVTRASSSDENDDAEKPEKVKKKSSVRKGRRKVDPDYWKNNDLKDDKKLQNPSKTKVVLTKLDKVMEDELKANGFVHIAVESDSTVSESEIADKRITRALRNFDKFDPLVTEERKERNSSKNASRSLRSRKAKKETKYNLETITGSEDNGSSDDSVRITTPKGAKKMPKDSSSNEESSASDNLAGSGSDNEAAKKNVLDDSEEEVAEIKIKKEKKENSEKNDKEKRKNYYVPAVCRLTSSDEDDDKRETKKSKPKPNVKSKKFSEDDSSDEFIPPRRRALRGKKKVSSGTEEISDSSDEDSDSSVKKKSKRHGKRQNSSSSEEETSKKKKRRRIKVEDSDDSDDSAKKNASDSDIQEVEVDKDSASPSKGRKKIRKVMSKKELEESTREAEKEEEERKRRVLEKQKLVIFNSQFDAPESNVIESLVLDFDPKTKETIVEADSSVVCKLKPHQAKGIKFIYDCTIESAEQIKKENPGGGCIIAHCMGLGKTLTTITFVHAALTHKVLNFKTVLIICPLNTVTNWYNELRSWLSDVDVRVNVHKLWDQKTNKDRASALAYFMRKGGVGIIHYDLFRRLADMKGQKKVSEKLKQQIIENLLDPGADIVVCDEGHVLKNDKSKLSIAVNKIKTRRRVVLTGTPLQNNLAEYHTMMSFVKPNLLGSLKEFQNRFINPIKNGQHADSNDYDVKLMKKRAHVLHKLLDGCVQRLDYTVLVPYLPPKHEYSVMVKITPKQVELYKHYLENLMSRTSVVERHRSLLKNYAYLLKIWTHPIILTRTGKKHDGSDSESDSESSMKDFIVDGSDSSSKSGESDSDDWVNKHNKKIKKKKEAEKAKEPEVIPDITLDETPVELAPDWYLKFFESKDKMMDPQLGGKFVVLMEIIKICESIGDKLLVFSQYLSSLNLIEEFLQHWDNEGKENERKAAISFPQNLELSIGRWRKNIEYYRIDGSTKTDVRQDQCDKFNNKHTTRAKLFLISTRAGGLGINLVGANRVVIFDASWNPSHDMQSIYRVYRFGQIKPCYIYRLLAEGTMEEKIYNRQVVKLSLSGRVVDEHQIERHFKFEETNSLYLYEDPDEKKDRPIPPVPKDRLLADLLISQKDRITSYLEHDTLLVNKVDEGLTEEERKAAWEEYNNIKENRQLPQVHGDSSTFYKIWSILQQRYPTQSPEFIKQWSDTILSKINELQICLNYYNLHQHSLSPAEDADRKNVIEALRTWISEALGTTTGAAPPQQHMSQQMPRMQMPAGMVQYPPAQRPPIHRTIVRPQNHAVQGLPQVDISSNILRQHMARPQAPAAPTHISQGMQEAIAKIGRHFPTT